MPGGICAGQAWESEAEIDLAAYHRAKTGVALRRRHRWGRTAAGVDPRALDRARRERIGEAFQVADDLRDVRRARRTSASRSARTPRRAGRTRSPTSAWPAPSAGSRTSSAGAIASIPACPGEADAVRGRAQAGRALTARGAGARRAGLSDSPAAARSGVSPVPDFDRAGAWRNRLIGSRRFQRWAAAFPLTRRLARRDGERLFDLMAGFVYSQMLLACVELACSTSWPGPPTRRSSRRGLGLTADARQRLLVGGGIARPARAPARRALPPRPARRAVRRRCPASPAMIRHHRLLYGDLADPVALLRGEARDRAGAASGPMRASAADDRRGRGGAPIPS